MSKILINVIPVNDKAIHIASQKCWCHPMIINGKAVHNAKDCREAQERRTGKQILEKQWTQIGQILE